MSKACDIPSFGTLQGVKVVFSATSVAGPFAASMYADHGADVIWLEHVSNLPIDRTGTTDLKKKPFWLEQDRRNMRSMKLDFKSPEGREILCKLLADTDIFLEASKGGAFFRVLTDEQIWEINPRCTILHLNGFGLTGLPEYVERASYDTIAQAYGGMIYANSSEGTAPSGVVPYIADYYSGWACFSAGLMGYIKALKTGKGDSVDIAQVESMIRCGGDKTATPGTIPTIIPGLLSRKLQFQHRGLQHLQVRGRQLHPAAGVRHSRHEEDGEADGRGVWKRGVPGNAAL